MSDRTNLRVRKKMGMDDPVLANAKTLARQQGINNIYGIAAAYVVLKAAMMGVDMRNFWNGDDISVELNPLGKKMIAFMLKGNFSAPFTTLFSFFFNLVRGLDINPVF